MTPIPLPPDTTQYQPKGLGIFGTPNSVYLYYALVNKVQHDFQVLSSTDGVSIETYHETPHLLDIEGNKIDVAATDAFRISQLGGVYALTYKYSQNGERNVYLALSKDLLHWKTVTVLPKNISDTAVIIPNHYKNREFVMFFGDHDIHVATSSDVLNWQVRHEAFIKATQDHFGVLSSIAGAMIPMAQGYAFLYFSRGIGGSHWSINGVMLDEHNPTHILWQADTIWEHHDGWEGKEVTPLGLCYKNKQLLSYWDFAGEGIYAVTHSAFSGIMTKKTHFSHLILNRIEKNPVISPTGQNYWETKQTFNAAAVFDRGKVHLMYRAIGETDTSVLGYASSSDGFHFDERLEDPAYVPTQPFELPVTMPNWQQVAKSFKSPYESGGGGYGGCEDPRLTKIDDTYYLTYVAYDGANPPRVALSSISEEDFHAQNWNWKPAVLISPPGVVDKNCVIFPEKINGKYAIMHRIYPNILIDFVDSLDFDGTYYLTGEYRIKPSRTLWDSRKVGAGAPPIKTLYGWLLIYHAVGEKDSGRYKIGAMLLDLHNPLKVLARSIIPILTPEHYFENEGFKGGVAYPCGAVIKDDQLIVYYGGADTYVCAAVANINDFLLELIATGGTNSKPFYKPNPKYYAHLYQEQQKPLTTS